jgi:hypothetical protein
VPRVGEQRQGAGYEPADYLEDEERRGQGEAGNGDGRGEQVVDRRLKPSRACRATMGPGTVTGSNP